MNYWPELVLQLFLGIMPGVFAGIVIGAYRRQPGIGLCSGAVSGTLGGIFGFLLFRLYESTLPYEERSDVFGPYHHIIDPPPRDVVWLAIIGGSLLFAILCTTLFVRRHAADANNDAGGKGGVQDGMM